MARVLHSINVTVGGACHHADVVADEEHHQYALELLRSASGVVLGRNTFDLFATFWPEAAVRRDLPSHQVEFAVELRDKPKYVVSTRSLVTTWANTTVLKGPDLGQVRELIHDCTGTVIAFGSPSLGTSLAAAGLVDEFHVLVQPFLAGATPRAFEGLPTRQRVTLLGTQHFRSGVVLLRYAAEA